MSTTADTMHLSPRQGHEAHHDADHKPRFFVRFPAGGPVLNLFGASETRPVYGRLGTIYCDEEPAIELLEIVTGVETNNPSH